MWCGSRGQLLLPATTSTRSICPSPLLSSSSLSFSSLQGCNHRRHYSRTSSHVNSTTSSHVNSTTSSHVNSTTSSYVNSPTASYVEASPHHFLLLRRLSTAIPSYWAAQGCAEISATPDGKVAELREQFDNLKGYSLEDLRSWLEAFDTFDHDSDGFISHADLQKNTQLTLEKMRILKQYDADQNNLIDFGEFVNAMFQVDAKSLKDSFDGFDPVDIQLEFDKFSTKDESGVEVISLARVKDLMHERNFISVNDRDAQTLFEQMDVNNDGVITVEDFNEWVRLR
eukprot:GHVS01025146.1.p1 GENE.GHVS01025146.1~~GHVS01025146.1.p1  ORF type:complete len:284 (-),score=61.71 GHVS01025146.1:192-1043(-)